MLECGLLQSGLSNHVRILYHLFVPAGSAEWLVVGIGGTEVIGRVVLAAAVDVVVKVASDRNASLARSKADEGANAR